MTETAVLCTTKGAVRMTRAELARLPVPEPRGRFHKPIPHAELLDTIETVLGDRGIKPSRFQIGVLRGTRLFAAIDFDPASPGLKATDAARGWAMGVRNSVDGRMACQLAAGGRTFLCDNMAFPPGLVSLKRRNTIRLDLKAEVDGAMSTYLEQVRDLDSLIIAAQEKVLTADQAKVLIYDAFMRNDVMAHRYMPEVNRLYFDTPEDHGEILAHANTLWALHSSFTRVTQQLPANLHFQATNRLGSLLATAKG